MKGYENLANSTPDIDPVSSSVPLSGTSVVRKMGRRYMLAENQELRDYALFYVGAESLTLNSVLMTHTGCAVFSFDPKTKSAREESAKVNRLLNRRYYMLQQAKDASVIGIVVGTLGAGKLRYEAKDHVFTGEGAMG